MKTNRVWRSALLAGAAAIAWSCGDRSSLGVGPRGPAPQAGLVDSAASTLGLVDSLVTSTGLLWCSPLPYDSVTQTVGPLGGTLQVGPHTLAVPPGALAAPVSITAVAPSDTVNRVRFQPEGLTFLQSAQLTMSYANCDLLGVLVPKRIAYTTGALDILEYLPSIDDPMAQQVTGRLEHFSDYAVAW